MKNTHAPPPFGVRLILKIFSRELEEEVMRELRVGGFGGDPVVVDQNSQTNIDARHPQLCSNALFKLKTC